MIEFRCKKCNHLLGKELITEGSLQIKCPRCGTFNTLEQRKGGMVDTKPSEGGKLRLKTK